MEPQKTAEIRVAPIHPEQMKDLENRFISHAPFGDLPIRYEAIRSSLFQNAKLLLALVPKSAEQTTAVRKLEEAMFWANAGIARHTKEPTEDKSVPANEQAPS